MDPAALARLNEISRALVEAYKDYAFNWALEKQARAAAIRAAWGEGYNSSQTSDFAFVNSVDEAVNTTTVAQDIKALEHEYAYVRFLLDHDLPLPLQP